VADGVENASWQKEKMAVSKDILRVFVTTAAIGAWWATSAAADDATQNVSGERSSQRRASTSIVAKTSERDIARLVMQLGHDRYSMREAAEAELLKIGLPASGHLAKAATHPDLELRTRARSVLDTIASADLEVRLRKFVEDGRESEAGELPGWSKFREVLGAERPARELFAMMQRFDPKLLAAHARGEAKTAELLRAYAEAFENSYEMPGENALIALLYVASDPDVAVDETGASALYSMLAFGSDLDGVMRGNRRELYRKLVARWIGREVPAECSHEGLWLSARFGIKEGLPAALAVLEKPQRFDESMYPALVVVRQFGGKDDLPLVERYLSSRRVCDTIQTVDREVDVQLRDAALAAAVKIAGLKYEDFGFLQMDDPDWGIEKLGFASRSDRTKALNQWSARSAAAKNEK
jgi:hypothetical protein